MEILYKVLPAELQARKQTAECRQYVRLLVRPIVNDDVKLSVTEFTPESFRIGGIGDVKFYIGGKLQFLAARIYIYADNARSLRQEFFPNLQRPSILHADLQQLQRRP